jgi:hypothetical protein
MRGNNSCGCSYAARPRDRKLRVRGQPTVCANGSYRSPARCPSRVAKRKWRLVLSIGCIGEPLNAHWNRKFHQIWTAWAASSRASRSCALTGAGIAMARIAMSPSRSTPSTQSHVHGRNHVSAADVARWAEGFAETKQFPCGVPFRPGSACGVVSVEYRPGRTGVACDRDGFLFACGGTEATVVLYRLLQHSAFMPEDITVMATAYEHCIRILNLQRDDPAAELVARKIIETAQTGVRDPVRLRHIALRHFRRPSAD